MRVRVRLMIAWALFIGELAAMSHAGPIKVLSQIRGATYLRIESAVKKVGEAQLGHLQDYEVVFATDGDSTAMVFVHRPDDVAFFGVLQSSKGEKIVDSSEVGPLLARLQDAKNVERIQGQHIRALQVAVSELRKQDLDVAGYRCQLVQDGSTWAVVFRDKDLDPGIRGGRAGRPGYEVELDPGDLKILRANFVR